MAPLYIIRKSSLLEDGMLAPYSNMHWCKKRRKKFERSGSNDRENYFLSCVDYACFITKNVLCSKNVQGIPNLSKYVYN